MNVLFVTSDPIEYNTSANLRNRGLIQGLVENGHAVSTVSLLPQENAISVEEVDLPIIVQRYFIPLANLHSKLTTKKEDTAIIRSLKRIISNTHKRLSIYDSRIRYVNNTADVLLSKQYDVMVSSSDPKSAHRIAEAVMKANPGKIAKWVQYWGDPFATDISTRQKLPNRRKMREEEALLDLAYAAVYASPLTAKVIKEQYPNQREKIFFIPTAYTEQRIYPSLSAKPLKLLYAGDYHERVRNIQPLIDAVNQIREIELTLVGKTDIPTIHSSSIQQMSRVPAEEVHRMESTSNVIVCLCNRTGNQIPGKFFQAAATNRPILLILDGENAEQIREYFSVFSRYIFCNNTVEDIKRSLNDLRIHPGDPPTPLEDFSAQNVARTFLAHTI